MPQPSVQITDHRPDLIGAMEEFPIEAAMAGSIAYQIAPPIEVALQADKYGRIPIEEYLQIQEDKRASGAGYPRDSFNFIDDNYATTEHGLEGVVDDRDAKRYHHYVQAEIATTKRKKLQILLNSEKRVSDLIMNATTFGSQSTALNAVLTNYTTSDPIAAVETAVQNIYDRTGMWANFIAMGRKNFRHMRHNTKIIDRINSNGAGTQSRASDITADQLSAVFDLEHVLVGGMASNSANRGLSASISSMWPDSYLFVGYLDASGDHQMPTLARTFHWSDDGSVLGGTIESYREDNKRSTIIRVRHDTHEKIEYQELGELITGAA